MRYGAAVKKVFMVSISVVCASMLFSGCAQKGSITPKNMKVRSAPKPFENINMTFNVKKGEKFSSILKLIEKRTDGAIVILNKMKSDIVFDRDMDDLSLEDIRNYISLRYGKIITFRKFGNRIVTVEESDLKRKVSKPVSPVKIANISKMKIDLKGRFTYKEIFNLLRKQGFRIVYEKFLSGSEFNEEKTIENFHGTLQDLFDLMAAKEKVFITSDRHKKIKITDVATKIYNLNLPMLDLEPKAISVGGDIKGVSVKGVKSVDPLEELQKQIEKVISSSDAGDGKGKPVFVLNKTEGTVTVVGDYKTIQVVDKIINNFKNTYSKTIKLNVSVYQVELDRNHAFGIDYSVLRNKLVGNSVQKVFALAPNLTNGLLIKNEGTFSFGNVSGELNPNQNAQQNQNAGTAQNPPADQQNGNVPPNNQGAVNNGYPTNQYNPYYVNPQQQASPERVSSFVFKFLNSFGKVSVLTKPILTTINNIPINLQILDTKDYVYRLNQNVNTVTNVNNAVVTNALQPEIKSITTGFSIVIHPKIEGDYIKLLLRMVSATNNGFDVYEYGTTQAKNKIYLKNVSSRAFEEILKIHENETAVIGGYIYEQKNYKKNAMPFVGEDDSSLDPFFSGKEKNRKKTEIVLVISAKVI